MEHHHSCYWLGGIAVARDGEYGSARHAQSADDRERGDGRIGRRHENCVDAHRASSGPRRIVDRVKRSAGRGGG